MAGVSWTDSLNSQHPIKSKRQSYPNTALIAWQDKSKGLLKLHKFLNQIHLRKPTSHKRILINDPIVFLLMMNYLKTLSIIVSWQLLSHVDIILVVYLLLPDIYWFGVLRKASNHPPRSHCWAADQMSTKSNSPASSIWLYPISLPQSKSISSLFLNASDRSHP